MKNLLWIGKGEKAVNPSKSFLAILFLPMKFVRWVFFRKVVYIAAALTIILPCLIESYSFKQIQVGPKLYKSSLVLSCSIPEHLGGSWYAGPVNKVSSVKKLNFVTESIPKFLGGLVEIFSSVSAYGETVSQISTKSSDDGTDNDVDDSFKHFIAGVFCGCFGTALGFHITYRRD